MWYGMISGVAGLIFRRERTSTPFASSSSISVFSACGESTTPLPIRHSVPSRRMPDGIRCSTVFLPLITSVWPALWPPWKRATALTRSVNRSTILPLPSSPHCAPRITTDLPIFRYPKVYKVDWRNPCENDCSVLAGFTAFRLQIQRVEIDLVDIAEAVAGSADRGEVGLRIERSVCKPPHRAARRAPEEIFAVRRDLRCVLVAGRVDAAAKRLCLRPCAVAQETDEDVRIAAAFAVVGHEEQRASVRRKERLVFVTGSIDRIAEVVRRGVLAVDEARAPDVGLALAAGAVGAEVQGAVGGDGGIPLLPFAVDRIIEMARLAPAVADAVRGPDVEIAMRLARHRAVGNEEQMLAVDGNERIGVLVAARRERREFRLGPAAVAPGGDEDRPVVEPRRIL